MCWKMELLRGQCLDICCSACMLPLDHMKLYTSSALGQMHLRLKDLDIPQPNRDKLKLTFGAESMCEAMHSH